MNSNLKMTMERSKRRSYFLSHVAIILTINLVILFWECGPREVYRVAHGVSGPRVFPHPPLLNDFFLLVPLLLLSILP